MEPLRPSLYPLPWVASLWEVVIEVEANGSSAVMPEVWGLSSGSTCIQFYVSTLLRQDFQKLNVQYAPFPVAELSMMGQGPGL